MNRIKHLHSLFILFPKNVETRTVPLFLLLIIIFYADTDTAKRKTKVEMQVTRATGASRHATPRRPSTTLGQPLLLVLVLAALLIASHSTTFAAAESATQAVANTNNKDAVAADAAAAAAAGGSDAPTASYAYLDKYSFDDLKKYAFDKFPGKIQVDKITERDVLLRAVRTQEISEDALAALHDRVAAAMLDATSNNRKNRNNMNAKRRHTVVVEVCAQSSFRGDIAAMRKDKSLYLGEDHGVDIDFSVAAHQPTPTKQAISNSLRIGFYTVIAAALAGHWFLPAAVTDFISRRRSVLFSGGMAMNMLSGSMLHTGGFEVYVNGALVYSRLETRKSPNGWTLSEIILNNSVLLPTETATATEE